MVQVEILTGPESGRVVDVGPGAHVVGRAAGNDVVLEDSSVSGRHLELTVGDDGSVRFRDLGSTNGSWSGGVQVEDGEWFTGTELKLGACTMRLLDASGAGADSDKDLHERAREAAMSGGRRGGPLQLVLVAVLVVAAGGAAWWTLGGGGGDEEDPDGRGPVAGGGPTTQYDLIDNLGDFASPESWSLASGVEIVDGVLRSATARSRATLSRTFPAVAALKLSGETGGTVVPVVAWGVDGDETPIAEWFASPLAATAAVMALPADADWFRIGLQLSAGAEVRGLVVDEGEASTRSGSAPTGELEWSGGNWMLSGPQGPELVIRGSDGAWSETDGGFDYAAEGGSELHFTATDALLDDGSFLILGSGGPVGLAGGVVVEDSPGLLIGGETGRFLIRFEPAARVAASGGGARVELPAGATLRWDLQQDLTEAARLSRAIQDQERSGDDGTLLKTVARLLRDYPLVDAQIIDAIQRSRASIERGRVELQALQTSTGAALFVASLEGMEELSAAASALAARYPGTDIDRQALELADVLGARAREVRDGREVEADRYRDRLKVALEGSYPLLAAWLQENQG